MTVSIHNLDPWFRLCVIFSMVGSVIYFFNTDMGSWLMGIGTAFGLVYTAPIAKELNDIYSPIS